MSDDKTRNHLAVRGAEPVTDLDRTVVKTIRALTMDAVQKANSGHPHVPMGMAEAAHVLRSRFLKHDPANPRWPNRDRFVLSPVRLVAKVDVVEPVGSEEYVYPVIGATDFVGRVDVCSGAKLGQELETALNMDHMHLFDAKTERVISPCCLLCADTPFCASLPLPRAAAPIVGLEPAQNGPQTRCEHQVRDFGRAVLRSSGLNFPIRSRQSAYPQHGTCKAL